MFVTFLKVDVTERIAFNLLDLNSCFAFNMVYRITGWVGRLGNHLIQLSNAIYVAESRCSLLVTPKHEFFKKTTFDFRRGLSTEAAEVFESCFFWPEECFGVPIQYDAIRRRILQKYVLPLFVKKSIVNTLLSFKGRRVGSDTLVINIRSGRDIFSCSPPPQSDYMQPPLSFYKAIIDSCGYEKCLIVTERDQLNPVIQGLLNWRSSIQLNQHQSVLDDLRLILAAKNLVLAHSTFTWCLALMSEKLEVLHQPQTIQIRGVPDIKIHTWSYRDYINPGEWRASEEQFRLMCQHPVEKVSQSIENASYLPLSCFGLSNDVKIEQSRSRS